jgi:molecular chaperone DnaK (HSP70)
MRLENIINHQVNKPIIGIDIGTTYSKVAVIENGCFVVINDEQYGHLIPSIVSFDNKNNMLVGSVDKNQYIGYSDTIPSSIKHIIGHEGCMMVGEKMYTAPTILALFLSKLKQLAENYLHQDVSQAIVTVPSFFLDNQRDAIRLAGQLAGLNVVGIINESIAAARAYYYTIKLQKMPVSKATIPYNIGISVLGMLNNVTSPYLFCPLIQKNTALPLTVNQAFDLSSIKSYPITISVYQGEHHDVRYNTLVGEFVIEQLPTLIENNKIIVTFHVDINANLQVTSSNNDLILKSTVVNDK